MINQKRLIESFINLVKIDSPSGEEKEVAEFLETEFTKIGGSAQYDSYQNLIIKIAGEGEPLMLNCHMDTVEPGRNIIPVIEDDIIKTNSETILGGDAKAGLAAIIEAVTSVIEDGKKHPPLELVFTREEELGLLGATNLDYSMVDAKRCITFDEEEGVENVNIAAPGYMQVNLKVFGKSAHAGAEPEKGISAIKIAAEIMVLWQVGRIDHETTANIGLINGGSARNAVPEEVEIRAEIRSRDPKKLEAHTIHFQEIVEKVREKNPQSSIILDLHQEFSPYKFNESHSLIQLVKKTLKKIDLEISLHESGGGTDVNILHTHGIEALCVGTGSYNAHTKREYVKISEMLKSAQFAEKVILNSNS